MITVERSITVDRPAGEVLRYLADFGNTVTWDPGTESCTRLDDGPVREGSRWLNVSVFRGRRTRLDYRLDRYEADRLVFVGENRTVTATDDIGVRARGGRTVVLYRAQLRFKGLARVAGPFLRPAFERLADEVAERLPRVLAAG
ncbi:polyketide cyclase [Kitasatospora herbaricolor]|uniref:SRPBCC family protein n=1 Tax=Kitasatospora herbaricolor TaxID=68217 RepID=UPI00174999B4|nr:SRPBCC family protein [Kitasatospora herbaricolor]MDQ0306063.1 carbon monoxide dehydrogenase subunit G [Kitasatospora herbaricolor]GGV23577.1 polyketide cyclase [Kitasatospora herbaricolor]